MLFVNFGYTEGCNLDFFFLFFPLLVVISSYKEACNFGLSVLLLVHFNLPT